MAIEGYESLVPVNFEEVPVFWCKALPGQEESFRDGGVTWQVDISLDQEMFEDLEDAGFNAKAPDKKLIRAAEKEGATEKDKLRAATEQERGYYVRAIRNKFQYGKDEKNKIDRTVILKEHTPPVVVDHKKNPWPADKPIGNGSICNVECVARYFQDNKFITLYLLAIQVVEYEAPKVPIDPETGEPIETAAVGSTFKVYE